METTLKTKVVKWSHFHPYIRLCYFKKIIEKVKLGKLKT